MDSLVSTNRILLGMSSQQQRIASYLARKEIEGLINSSRLDLKRLEPYGYKVYSQGDEDGIIEEIFNRLKIDQGTFCEIGVENGLECNSLFLLHKGWRGAWLEGNEKQREPIETKFASLIQTNRLMLGIGFVTPENINTTLKKCSLYDDIDFLSIDIDGNDIYLFEALECKPKVVCIEYNAKFPAHIKKQPVANSFNQWKGGDYMGASLAALDDLARSKGYSLVGTNLTGANAFFVRNDLIEDKFTNPATPKNLYNPPRYYLIFDHYHHIGHRADFGLYVDLT
jgi:hypothetical protein